MQSQQLCPLPAHLAQEFLAALRSEYVHGEEGGVGSFYQREGAESFEELLDPVEDRVRSSSNPSRVIEMLAEQWCLTGPRHCQPTNTASTAFKSHPPVAPHVARGFLEALRSEYVCRQQGAVGDFMEEEGVEEFEGVLDPYEDKVRCASDPAATIESIAAAWGLGAQNQDFGISYQPNSSGMSYPYQTSQHRQEPDLMSEGFANGRMFDLEPSRKNLLASGNGQFRAPLAGKRRSLLIGINYFGSSSQLNGCINDVKRMIPLVEYLGFPDDPSSQQVLLDDGSTHLQPTLENIRAAIAWLVEGASAGDALFFHYSGHGGRMQKADGSGFHETLCPVDMESAGQLLDVELFDILIRPLPTGCRLTCILDSCHSAGALNLPYLFTGTESNLKKALAGEAVQLALSKNWMQDLEQWRSGDQSALISDVGSLGLGLWQMWGKYKASKGANQAGFKADEEENAGLAVGEVVAITGCASEQTSADVGNVAEQFSLQPSARGNAGGALTSAFVEALETQGATSLSYLDLLENIRQKLADLGFTQVPQLASSLLIDLHQPFSVTHVTLPADPSTTQDGSAARGGDDGSLLDSGGAATGFMAALAAAPLGMQMMQGEDDYSRDTLNESGNDDPSFPNLLESIGMPGVPTEKIANAFGW